MEESRCCRQPFPCFYLAWFWICLDAFKRRVGNGDYPAAWALLVYFERSADSSSVQYLIFIFNQIGEAIALNLNMPARPPIHTHNFQGASPISPQAFGVLFLQEVIDFSIIPPPGYSVNEAMRRDVAQYLVCHNGILPDANSDGYVKRAHELLAVIKKQWASGVCTQIDNDLLVIWFFLLTVALQYPKNGGYAKHILMSIRSIPLLASFCPRMPFRISNRIFLFTTNKPSDISAG